MPARLVACSSWLVACSRVVNGNEISDSHQAWTLNQVQGRLPDLGGMMPPRPGKRRKAGCRRLDVGGGFCLLRASKRVWHGSENRKLIFLLPTPYNPPPGEADYRGSMSRHDATVRPPKKNTPSPGGGLGRGLLTTSEPKSPVADVWPAYIPLPTSHTRAQLRVAPQIMLPPLGEGRGGGCWRCLSQILDANSWPPYARRSTTYIPNRPPLATSQGGGRKAVFSIKYVVSNTNKNIQTRDRLFKRRRLEAASKTTIGQNEVTTML